MVNRKRIIKKHQKDNTPWIIAIVVALMAVVAVATVILSNQAAAQQQTSDLSTQAAAIVQATQLSYQAATAAAQPAGAATQPAASPAAAQPTQPVQPAQGGAKQFSAYPAMTIDKAKQYTATIKMAKGGEIVIQLYPDKAPLTVNSFVFLARQKFFDGTTFHRVLDGFMAQGGDPTGTGGGGPGYQYVNEDSDLKFDKPGVVAMANAGRDTNGSQFFITFVPTPQLDGGYTIFGQVTSGMDVVNAITRRDPNQNPTFTGDAIATVTITEK
jgi:cyclophilin family peptidyl-prolyl cis-trans isomerase